MAMQRMGLAVGVKWAGLTSAVREAASQYLESGCSNSTRKAAFEGLQCCCVYCSAVRLALRCFILLRPTV